jgi:hypothetical protein
MAIEISLEERLVASSQKYNPDEFGELNTLVHQEVDQAFFQFLDNALKPFLNGRPAHSKEVDLLHILAMAIHPHPPEFAIRETLVELGDSQVWQNTKLLMNHLTPHSFQLHYLHRLELVQIVTDHLVLPEHSSSDQLFQGAIPHLRASLYAFGLAASSPRDAHWAQCGLVSVAIQLSHKPTLKEEWGRLLHRLVDDRTNYNYHRPTSSSISASSFSFMISIGNDNFCPHRARGHLLEGFLKRFSQSRHYAKSPFLQHALGSLTEAIEWLVECWTKEVPSDDDELKDEAQKEAKDELQTTNDPPEVLESLLFAAKTLFYYLSPIASSSKSKHEKGEESEDSRRRDMLVSCGIQLLHHSDKNIANEASNLLVLAFSYGPADMTLKFLGTVFESTKLALDQAFQQADSEKEIVFPIEGTIATFAEKSQAYADSMLSLLLSPDQQTKWNSSEEKKRQIAVFRLIAAIATASPTSAVKRLDILLQLLDTLDNEKVKRHILVALMACHKARLFNQPSLKSMKIISKAVNGAFCDDWQQYLLARHALVAGNFGFAKTLYGKLSESPTVSEYNYLWLSLLEKVATAETLLADEAASGIPLAAEQLRSATLLLNSLPLALTEGSSNTKTSSFSFQTKFLNLRLEFLDLLLIIRQLTQEMRVTCVGPKKNTRPSLHLRRSVRYFDKLSIKYLSLYREYGLFIDQQSRTSLRTLHVLCRFLAKAARCTFADALPVAQIKEAASKLSLKGDARHPLTILINKLDTAILQNMTSATVDTKIRAAAMLEIIDGILKAPCPFPRGFIVTQSIPRAAMKLCADPESTDHYVDDSGGSEYDYFDDEIEVSIGSTVIFYASGFIPVELLKKAQLPFYIVVLWQTIRLQLGTANNEENSHPEQRVDLSLTESIQRAIQSPPKAASLSSNGTFFMKVEVPPLSEEGLYSIETKLGCRDIRGGEWQLFLQEPNHCISVRVKK